MNAQTRDELLNRHRYISYKDAADLLGISDITLRRLVKAGEGPTPVQLSPRRVAFRLAELEDWLTSRRVTVPRECGR